MRTIKEDLEIDKLFESMVFESVFERHMSMVIDQFKKYAANPSVAIRDFFKKLGFAVDKVDASRVTVFDYIDRDAEKEINNALDDKDKVVFGLIRNPANNVIHVAVAYVPKLEGKRNEDPWVYLPTKEGHEFGHWECIRQNPLHDYQEKAAKNRIKTFKHCCEVWIVDISGSLDISNLQKNRKNAQYGVWENTPEFYAKVAKQNLERYKQMVTKIKMEKGSDFEKMMKDVDETVNKLYKVFNDMHNNMKNGGWGSNSNVSYNATEFNSSVTTMLRCVSDVLNCQRDYEKALKDSEDYKKEHPEYEEKGSSIFSVNWYLDKYREAIEDVNDYRKRAEDSYQRLMKAIKEYKERTGR